MRPDQQDAGQMDRGCCQHLEQQGKLPSQPRRPATPLSFVLRHAQLVDAIRVERRTGPLAVDPACLYLAQMREQLSHERIGTPHQPLDLAMQDFVTELRKSREARHAPLYTHEFVPSGCQPEARSSLATTLQLTFPL